MERPSSMLSRDQKIAIYMEGAVDGAFGKMGFGILRYSQNPIVCVIDSKYAGQDAAYVTRIPRPCPIVGSVEEATAFGAEVLVLGIAPGGGLIPKDWYPIIDLAIKSGMSVVNGLHDLLGPHYPNLPAGQWIWDIRIEPEGLAPGTGASEHLSNRRALLIGTDMAVGKMTAGLEIYRVANERGIKTEFVATGQIGITITGAGIPLDAIRIDFASGAVEREVLRATNDRGAELVIIEGQGSLIHPGSSANLPLLRGSCPTDLILCHRAGQEHLMRSPDFRIPPLRDFANLYEDLGSACGTFRRPKTVAVSLNTFDILDDQEALDACKAIEDDLNLPCVDPVRHGPDRIVDALA